jgi:hypothetical protein
MSSRSQKVEPIPPRAAAAPLPEAISDRIEEARAKLFGALSITEVMRAAARSEELDLLCSAQTLRIVFDMLNDVAAMIEPAALAEFAANAEVVRG